MSCGASRRMDWSSRLRSSIAARVMTRNDARPIGALSTVLVFGCTVLRFRGNHLTILGADGKPLPAGAARDRVTREYWRMCGVRGNDPLPDDDRQSER